MRLAPALSLLCAFGCAAAPAPSGVALPPVPAPTASSTPAAPCVIRGGGELVEGEAKPLLLYASVRESVPGLELVRPAHVSATWSELPSVGSGDRASIELGGQKLLRVHAHASLAERGFQLRARADAVRDHLWLDGGHVVELLGLDHGAVVVRRPTTFAKPAFVEARVGCDVVAWEPSALVAAPAEDDGDRVQPSRGALQLYGAPGGSPFLELVVGERAVSFLQRERREGWVRIGFHERGIGLDAWVRDADVREAPERTIDLGNIHTIARDGIAPKKMRVRRESPVLVGKTRAQFADAVFEEGALLDAWVNDGGLLEVTFESRAIRAPDGMWIAADDAEPR